MAGSVVNMVMSNTARVVPEVDMGVTVLGYSDRAPGTIVWVSPDKNKIKVQRDAYKRIDKNGQSEAQEYEITRDKEGGISVYTFRKNGKWVAQGQAMRSGQCVSLGHRDVYYDFSF